MKAHTFYHPEEFELESGEHLPSLQIAYSTAGQLNADQSNVIWVCHALTANSNAADWWNGLVGEGYLFNPEEHFIICANIIGSSYGSSSPVSENPLTGKPYFTDFPQISIRDIVNSLDLLRRHLGIEKINTCIGGSLGGQQALEWSILHPDLIENLILIATNAQHSAWGIAFNETQRLAIQADPTWNEPRPDAGQAGLKAARAAALLSYRNYDTYGKSQSEDTNEKTGNFKASAYQQYQGQKLVDRFNVLCYLALSKAMDSHNVGRGRGSVEKALKQVKSNTLVVGITSDILFPVTEQIRLAQHIERVRYAEISSGYGHDGFLVETQKLTHVIQNFFQTASSKELLIKNYDFFHARQIAN